MAKSAKDIGKMVTTDVDKALANIGSMRPDMKADETVKAAAAPQKAMSFAEAFRAARKDPEAMKRGNFTFGGKSFSTKMAGEGAKRPAASTVSHPAASTVSRPAASTASASPTTSRAQMEAKRTAARSQEAIRDKRAENQAGFRERMQAKRATASKGPINAGRSKGNYFSKFVLGTSKDFEESQKKKYGYKKGGSVDGCAIRGKTRAPMKKGK